MNAHWKNLVFVTQMPTVAIPLEITLAHVLMVTLEMGQFVKVGAIGIDTFFQCDCR